MKRGSSAPVARFVDVDHARSREHRLAQLNIVERRCYCWIVCMSVRRATAR
jgi:hypothetical protein